MSGFNFTQSRISLMEQMMVQGPQAFADIHWTWMQDLHAMKRHRIVTFRGGLWRATKHGRELLKQRTGLTWEDWIRIRNR